ncbi:MAG: hypothetical protein R2752_02960 [Vicinamibacterales bacterium]
MERRIVHVRQHVAGGATRSSARSSVTVSVVVDRDRVARDQLERTEGDEEVRGRIPVSLQQRRQVPELR